MALTSGAQPHSGVRIAAIVFALAAAWPACAQGAQPTPRFETVACWFPVAEGERATCAHMHVPENRSRADTRSISFPVVILHAHGDPLDDPLVVAGGGGPGGSLRLEAQDIPYHFAAYAGVALDRARDVVLVEQRGVGRSVPSLDCPEISAVAVAELGKPNDLVTAVAAYGRAGTTCRDRLVASGVDLGAYRGDQSAADLEDLRAILGIEKWNLWGTSYGARLVLTAMRDFPKGVRSAILDSPVPFEVAELERLGPDGQRVLRKLFDDCAAQPTCRASFPTLREDFETLRERLAKTPIEIELSHPKTLEPTRVWIDDGVLASLLIYGFYDASVVARMPLMLSALRLGNSDLIAPLARILVEQAAGIGMSEGLYLSTMCSDEFPFNDMEMARRAARAHPWVAEDTLGSLELMRTLCELWPTAGPNPIESQALASPIPTLVLSGEFDPVTPPSLGARIHAKLANSRFFRFPGASHDVFAHTGCADRLMAEFLERPGRKRYGDCPERESALEFSVVP